MRLRIAPLNQLPLRPAGFERHSGLADDAGQFMTGSMSPSGRSTSSTDSRLDVHQDAFGNVTHVLTYGPIADLTINVEGLIETHDTGGVLRGTEERFPPSLFLRSTPLTLVSPAMATFFTRTAFGIGRRRAWVSPCADGAESTST